MIPAGSRVTFLDNLRDRTGSIVINDDTLMPEPPLAPYPSQPGVTPHASYCGDNRCPCGKTAEGCATTSYDQCLLQQFGEDA